MYREKVNNYIFMYIYVFLGGEDRDVSRGGSVYITGCMADQKGVFNYSIFPNSSDTRVERKSEHSRSEIQEKSA